MVQRCEMGLFPEIGRAWLAIDTNIYIWKYDTGTDVAYYDSLSCLITNVGLVKPKEGVFKSHIKYILILVTLDQIILLGITFSDPDNKDDPGDLIVIPEPIFELPSDNVEIKVIRGTEDGRIFLGDSGGCLCEITYQADLGWFGRKCRKVNHSISALSFLVPKILKSSSYPAISQIEIDKSRNLLYTLDEAGVIDVYDLGTEGKTTYRAASRTCNSIYKEALSYLTTVDESSFNSIVSINAVEEQESIHIHLVAVTKGGVRYYLTTTNINSPDQRPFTLNLLHIRLPPEFSPSIISRTSLVHISYYKKGNFMLISSRDNKDVLSVFSNDSFAYNTNLSELYSVIPLNTKIWTMAAEEKVIPFKPFQSFVIQNKSYPLESPSIMTQHLESAKKFVFLTTEGVIIGYKSRIVDQLKQLLLENQGFDNEPVKAFFRMHNTFQTNICAVALIIACDSPPPGEEKLKEWATSAFFHYGSSSFDAKVENQVNPMTTAYNTPVAQNKPFISTPISSSRLYTPSSRFGMDGDNVDSLRNNQLSQMSPINQNNQQTLPPLPLALDSSFHNYSNRCRGLFLYFSRLIRPYWNLKTAKVILVPQQKSPSPPVENLASNITVEEIKVYLFPLTSLYSFLKTNMKFSSEGPERCFTNVHPDMHSAERNILYYLFKLIEHCIEVLNLWKLLVIHNFNAIVAHFPATSKTQLCNVTFKDLIVSDSELTTLLASALVQRFIEDNSTTDIINKRLQDLCPSIYKNENALHAKVHEMIVRAKSLNNENERKTLLTSALDLCKKIGSRINLASVCEMFQSVNWYEAVVDICLTTAQSCDPQDLALYYYKNRNTVGDDQNTKSVYLSRLNCYQRLLEVYGQLVMQGNAQLTSRIKDDTQSFLSPEEVQTHSDNMLRLAIQSNDELFHYILYNWLYENGQSDKLLEIKSPHLEEFLKEKTSKLNESVVLTDFLWMYYERNGHYFAASQILTKLCEQESNEVSLAKRLEYLSRAIVCMKSLDTRVVGSPFGKIDSAAEFLHCLEEKMEVARIQMQILHSIERSSTAIPNRSEVIRSLNSKLHDITTLYKEFAEPFALYECQLKILHCANHDDDNLIEFVWQNIIETEWDRLSGMDPQTQMSTLKSKIKELGLIYMKSRKYFPIGNLFILKHSKLLIFLLPF